MLLTLLSTLMKRNFYHSKKLNANLTTDQPKTKLNASLLPDGNMQCYDEALQPSTIMRGRQHSNNVETWPGLGSSAALQHKWLCKLGTPGTKNHRKTSCIIHCQYFLDCQQDTSLMCQNAYYMNIRLIHNLYAYPLTPEESEAKCVKYNTDCGSVFPEGKWLLCSININKEIQR